LLRYPSKLLASGDGRLFVADTGHHRVLELRLEGADAGASSNGASPANGAPAHPPRALITRVFGDGEPGLVDGPPGVARFHDPHGMALVAREGGETLYVADTENHAIRAIDLADGAVRTVAGTGEKGGYAAPGEPLETALRSPWALWGDGQALLIAMAGSHQIWALIGERELGVFAGNGREALVDGPRAEASFNQPSDLDVMMGHLVVADSEASAVRAIRLDEDPRVFTLVGLGLFEFGDVDGAGSDVRLQHPTGLAADEQRIYIADSYNHKIKVLDPGEGEVVTLAGTGEAGAADGALAAATFYEPEGLALDGDRLYVADTNSHAVRVIDLAAGWVSTLEIEESGSA
jgi:hypothetical protein